jgi:non-specific serine/threonine protein kinase
LESLAANNLVLHETRFGMLETIRELASERLAESGEEAAIRNAHARAYLALVEEGGPNRRGDDRAAWLARVGAERENLRAALAWGGDAETSLRVAAAMAPFWVAHGLIDEGKRSLAAVLDRAREPSLGRTRALAADGLLRLLDGDLEGGEAACRASVAVPQPGEEWYRAVALNVLGTVARYRRRWDEARRLYDGALALATAHDLWWPAVLAHANLGELAVLQDRPAEAVDRHEQSVAMAREGGDEWMLAACLTNTGRAVRQVGLPDRASALQAEALRRFAALENAWGIAASVAAFAALAADRGRHVRAARLYGAEEAIRERARLSLWPTIQAEHEAGVRATVSALGDAAWERARSQGRGLTQSEAIAEALALRPSLASG